MNTTEIKSVDSIMENLIQHFKNNSHIAICGPAGCGKNYLARQVLEAVGKSHHIIDVDGKADAYSLLKEMEGHERDNVLISVSKFDLENEPFVNVLKGLLDREEIFYLENEPFVNVLKGLLDREEIFYLTPTRSTNMFFTGNIIMTTEEINSKSLVSRFVRIDIPGPKKV